MPTTDTDLTQLVINVGTTAQIEAGISGGTITNDMLSLTTDGGNYLTTSDVTSSYSSTGTAPVNGTAVASALSTLSIPTETTVANWGFTKNIGTVISVNNVSPVNGNVSLSIPTVNNATLTIQKNGTTVNTFTANASSDVTANITVPTDTNELTNGAGFITSSALTGYLTTSDIVSSVDSSSTNSKAVGAKLFYDTCGDIETLINAL